MSSPTLRRTTLVLLLATLLTSPWAFAAGPKAPSNPKAATPAFSQHFSQAWSFLTSLWAEEGCHIDPNGRCLTSPVRTAPKVDTDTGCHIDPDGRCTP